MFQQLLQNQFSKGLNFDQQQTVQLDLLLDGGLIEKQFIFEMKENSGHEDTHSVRLWPWTQLKKSTMKKKSTAEEQRDTTQRGKIAEVPRIGERGSKKGGTARLHSCPSKEQMSLFFLSFPLMLLSPHPRERGRGGGRRQGRLGGGTWRGSGLMNTTAWQSCSILWPKIQLHQLIGWTVAIFLKASERNRPMSDYYMIYYCICCLWYHLSTR